MFEQGIVNALNLMKQVSLYKLGRMEYSNAVIDSSLLSIAGVRFASNNKIRCDPDRIDLSSGNLKPPFEEDQELSAIEIVDYKLKKM